MSIVAYAQTSQYDDPQYIKALRILQADDRIRYLGLCNFDTSRLTEILAAGIKIVTNQVQVCIRVGLSRHLLIERM